MQGDPLDRGAADADLARLSASGLLELDVVGRIVAANDTFAGWVGVDAQSLQGRALTEFLIETPAPGTTVADPHDRTTGPEGTRSVIVDLVSADGPARPVIIGWTRHDDRVFVTVMDGTARRAFEERLLSVYLGTERNERRLGILLDAAVSFAAAPSEGEVAELLNQALTSAYSATAAAVYLIDEDGLISLAAGTDVFAMDAKSTHAAGEAATLRSAVPITDVAGSPMLPDHVKEGLAAAGMRSVLIAPIFDGAQYGVFIVYFDHVRRFDEQAAPLAWALGRHAAQVIGRVRLQDQLHELAMLDPTTGLPNRRVLEERIDEYAMTGDVFLAVVFVDLDGFKSVNDRFGHDTGDEVLKAVGARLEGMLRTPDVVMRFGGDEFVALCEVPDERAALEIAERIRRAVREPYPGLPDDLHIGASVGVATRPPAGEPLIGDRLVRLADQAMYAAKAAGGDRVVLRTSS